MHEFGRVKIPVFSSPLRSPCSSVRFFENSLFVNDHEENPTPSLDERHVTQASFLTCLNVAKSCDGDSRPHVPRKGRAAKVSAYTSLPTPCSLPFDCCLLCDQVDEMGNTNRPVQPLNDRKLYFVS